VPANTVRRGTDCHRAVLPAIAVPPKAFCAGNYVTVRQTDDKAVGPRGLLLVGLPDPVLIVVVTFARSGTVVTMPIDDWLV
jgi:hypothetical protein